MSKYWALIWARPFAALRDWTQQARSCTASAFNGTGCWTFWKVWIPALLRWRLAAARITLVVVAFNTVMSLD
ncbi:hypothetical protein KMP13_13230 [Epibacterium ulvae]|nr:hypothetical protein [Epibacterium ulvae]